MKSLLLVLVALWVLSLPLTAQERTLSKIYNPVVIKAEQLSVDSLRLEEWTAYAFHAADTSWQPIPFQMDEIDADGRYLSENDGFLDGNDELLFMPEDAGDQAPESSWLNGLSALSPNRIEIKIVEPLHPEQQAWVYLYHGAAKSTPGYFQYISASDGSAADTIQTRSYKIGHNDRGWTDYVSLSLNWQKDLIDRIKFHINGGGGSIADIYLTEDTLKMATEQFYLRPVRSFQKVKTRIKLSVPPLLAIDKEDHFIITFLPYSTWLGAGFQVDQTLKFLLVMLKIHNIRLSVDLNPSVSGMKFISAANSNGFAIDGLPDSPNLQLFDLNGTNWVMASGSEGSILAFFDFPEVQGALGRLIYYRDQLQGGTNEGTPDTGDQFSFGDMGLWVTGEALVPQFNSLYIAFTTYYIHEANQDATFARNLLASIQNPLHVEAVLQTHTTDVVQTRAAQPVRYRLFDAFPNPYTVSSGSVVFRIEFPEPSRNLELVIFNLLGQQVAELRYATPGGRSGVVEMSWDGRDEKDEILPSGLYFYRLRGEASADYSVKKLLLLR